MRRLIWGFRWASVLAPVPKAHHPVRIRAGEWSVVNITPRPGPDPAEALFHRFRRGFCCSRIAWSRRDGPSALRLNGSISLASWRDWIDGPRLLRIPLIWTHILRLEPRLTCISVRFLATEVARQSVLGTHGRIAFGEKGSVDLWDWILCFASMCSLRRLWLCRVLESRSGLLVSRCGVLWMS